MKTPWDLPLKTIFKKNKFLPFVTEEAGTQKQDKYHGTDRNENTNDNGIR